MNFSLSIIDADIRTSHYQQLMSVFSAFSGKDTKKNRDFYYFLEIIDRKQKKKENILPKTCSFLKIIVSLLRIFYENPQRYCG